MFGTGGFEKNINVVVGGNAAGYMTAMTAATSVTKAFKLGVAAAGAAIVVFSGIMLKKAVSAAADFEGAMAKVKAVTQDTTKTAKQNAEAFELLTDKAKELGRETKFTMMDIAGAEQALGRAGFTTNEILSSMAGIADLAAASGIDLAYAADIAAKTIRALGLEASDSTRIADVFAYAAANANVDVMMLGESMKYVAPLARAAGYSLEETVAILAKFGDVGIQGSMAGTSLRFAFSALLAETDAFKESMDDLGMSMDDVTGPDGELMDFVDILAMLEEAGADTGNIIEMMGKRAGPAIAALLANVPGLKEFTRELENSTGAAKTMADILRDNLEGQLEVLQGSWQLLFVTVGGKVTDVLQSFIEDTLIPAVNEFAAWAEESDALEKSLETFFETAINGFTWLIDNYGKVVAGLEAIMIAFGVLIATKVVAGVKALTASIVSLFAVLTANPLFWPLLGLSAAVYAAPRIPDYYNLISDAMHGLDDKLVEGIFGPEAERKVTQAVVDFMSKGINDAETQLLASGTLSVEIENALAWDIAAIRGAAMESLESGMGMDFVLAEYKTGVEGILDEYDLLGTGIHAEFVRILDDTVSIWEEMTGVIRTEVKAWEDITNSFFTPSASLLGFTNPFSPAIPSASQSEQLGPTIARAQDLMPSISAETPEDILNLSDWRDSMDELRTLMTDTPTQATSALKEFMTQFGSVPAALLAGSGAARSVLSDLEELQRMGVEGLAGDISYLEGLVGITAQEAADAAKQAIADDKVAAAQAKTDADALLRKNEEIAIASAELMRTNFESKFTDPIAQALATGDWEQAAQAVKAMAVSFPELTADAADVSAALEKVGLAGISQIDVMQALTGMESELVSVLQDRIALAELAGDLDMAKSLGEILDSLFDGTEDTWQEKTSEWLDKGFGTLINAAISILPDKLEKFASGIFDIFSTALTNPLDAIAKAIVFVVDMLQSLMLAPLQAKLDDLNEQLDGLNERLAELKDQHAELKNQEAELLEVFSFYTETMRSIGAIMNSVFSKFGMLGEIASATMDAFISSVEMLTLSGIDLLRAGMQMLTNFIGSLVNSIMSLIEKSDAYNAVQSEGARAWKAISDLFGQFLWPLAALLQHILDWLGIQTEANAQAAIANEIGVPAMFKRASRAYESAAPGEIFAPEATGGGEVEIPAWATAVVEGIAEAVEALLKSFGIDSWADLLEKFKAGSITFWNYVTANIPKLIGTLTTIFNTLSDAFGSDFVGTIVGWLKDGFDWLINEGPGVVRDAVDFIEDLFKLASDVWGWLQQFTWAEIKALIEDKFAEFITTLEEVGEMTDVVDEIALVRTAIDGVATAIGGVETRIGEVKTAITGVEEEMARMKATLAIAFITVGAGIIGAIAGGSGLLGNAVTATAGALLGISGGLILSGILGALGALGEGFAEGGVFNSPTMLPAHMVAEGGVPEAYLPLSKEVFGNIGQGISDAGGGGSNVINNYIKVVVGEEELSDILVESSQSRSKYQTGRYATTSGLTGRY